jgi:two-component system, sensor histidine kinase PdtaS
VRQFITSLVFIFFCQILAVANPIYNKASSTKEFSTEYNLIAQLYELIVSDIAYAEKKIDSLLVEVYFTKNKDLIINVLLLEAEMYRSKGDYAHMKLSMYQAMTWQNEHTLKFNKKLIKFYTVFNDFVSNKSLKYDVKLESLARECRKNDFLFIEAKIYQTLGKYYSDIGKYFEAEQYLLKAKSTYKKLKFSTLVYEIDINRAVNFYWEGSFAKALKLFHQAKKVAAENGYVKCYLFSILNIAEAHLFHNDQLDSASFYYNLFEKQKNEADFRDFYQYYWGLTHFYKKKKDVVMREKSIELMHQINDSIQSNMLQNLNVDIDKVYKKLQNERFLNDDNQRQKMITLIVVFICIFLLLIALVFWFIIREKGKVNDTLSQQKDEITVKKILLDQALKEKEILLKEIHHRVKNNLQIISSLLSLQSKNINDKTAKAAIFEGKDRIQAIALIHQKLYQNDTFATIEMKSYLEDLLDQLSNSYDNQVRNVSIKLQTNDIVLNLDTVVPLGLIICELVTNAFKYAFKNTQEPKLRIEISELEGYYQLSVRDNGNGMDETFDFLSSPTLGVEIIQALTEQLDGIISFKTSDKGTSIKIKFKEVKNI